MRWESASALESVTDRCILENQCAMEEASVEKEHATGAREFRRPVRIDVALKVAVGVRLHDEGTVSCVAHVDKHPDGGFKMRRAWVGHAAECLKHEGTLFNENCENRISLKAIKAKTHKT